MDCKKDSNKHFCTCTFSCSKKGACCDCLSYHRRAGELPACYFPPDAERTGDRSIENFIRLFQQKGAWWN
ncbi:MAG: hypothetical protein JW801_13720 [Bacteroidales bacterium]|nr:hypothetical protein [Bacteroidales bacterium]